MSITLYGSRFGSAFRPHWMLHELNLPYETKELNFKEKEQRSEWYLKLNPAGEVPVIDIDGFLLAESIVITQYLAAKHQPALLGSLEENAKGSQWALWILLHVQNKGFNPILMPTWTGVQNDAGVEAGKEQLTKDLPVLETYLSAHRYLGGDSFTVADVNGASTFNYAEMAQYDLSAYPSIQAWLTRCYDRPAYKAAKGA